MDAIFHPVMQALDAGDLDRVTTLLQSDPDLLNRRSSTSSPTLLQHVAVNGGLGRIPDALDAAKLLLDAGAGRLDEAIVAAASVGFTDLVRHLVLDRAVPVDAGAPWTALDEASYWVNRPTMDFLVEQDAPVTTLRLAAALGDLERMEAFLASGGGPVRSPFADTCPEPASSERKGILDNALITAVHNQQREAVAWLLERGADPDGKPPGFHWPATARGSAERSEVDWSGLLG